MKTEYLNIIPVEICTGCGACSAICPKSCITIDEDRYGFRIPSLDSDACIHCGLCEKACPVLNSDCSESGIAPLKVVATRNQNKEVVAVSSSGGMFSAFAEYIFDKGGTVYGVTLTHDLTAEHIRVENRHDIWKIQGSKYLHSNAAKAYPSVKEDLNTGKYVLFSGTPCQIAALRYYLRKDYPKLLCIEVVCHGVPTNFAFREYVKWLESKYKSQVVSVNFRDKTKGWHDNSISFRFNNGKIFSERGSDNLYCQGYVRNLFVRDSCTTCKFKDLKSKADITLGDMWGIENIDPSYDTADGVSMVSINSNYGETAFECIKDKLMDCIEVSFDDVVAYNGCISKSVAGHSKRSFVLDGLSVNRIDILIKDALGINFKTQFIKKYSRIKSGIIRCLVSLKHSYFNFK